MEQIKRILCPNRIDSLLFVVALILLLTCASPFLLFFNAATSLSVSGYFTLIACCITSMVAIGAVIGLNQHSPRRVRILVLVCIVAPLASAGLYYLLESHEGIFNMIMPPQDAYGILYGNTSEDQSGFLTSSGSIYTYLGMIFSPVVSWLLMTMCRIGPTGVATVFKRVQLSRSRLLIGIAVVLFILGFVNNVLNSVQGSFDHTVVRVVSTVVFSSAAIFIAGLIIYWPTKILSGGRSVWLKSSVALVLLAIVGGIAAIPMIASGQASLFEAILFLGMVLFALAVYLFTVVGVSRCKDASSATAKVEQQEEVGEELANQHTKIGYRFPSIWGVAAVVLFMGSLCFPFQYDVWTLLNTAGDFKLARKESVLRAKSGGSICRTYEWGNSLFFCRFDETSEADVLKLLDDEAGSYFAFDMDAPQVSFAYLAQRVSPLAAYFDHGKVTTTQLNDFMSQPASFVRFSGAEVVEDGQKIDPQYIDVLYLVALASDREPNVGHVLSCFKTFENVKEILVQTEVTGRDWPAIAEAAKTTQVKVYSGIPSLTSKQLESTGSGVRILSGPFAHNLGRNQAHIPNELSDEQKSWFKYSKAVEDFYWSNENGVDQLQHDVLFAFPFRFYFHTHGSPTVQYPFNQKTESNHYVYEWGGDDLPRRLFLPYGDANSQLQLHRQLQSLSFDERWFQKTEDAKIREPTDLRSLVNLESLYFSSSSDVTILDFLLNMKKLKHLQVPTVDRTSGTSIGFDVCPSLESICMLGVPDDVSTSEFARLPNLKSLKIVDLFDEFGSVKVIADGQDVERAGQTKEEFLAKLKKKLAGVDVEFVESEKYSELVPDDFRQYLDRKSTELREKLLGGGAITEIESQKTDEVE